jgi:hypothetical protein
MTASASVLSVVEYDRIVARASALAGGDVTTTIHTFDGSLYPLTPVMLSTVSALTYDERRCFEACRLIIASKDRPWPRDLPINDAHNQFVADAVRNGHVLCAVVSGNGHGRNLHGEWIGGGA